MDGAFPGVIHSAVKTSGGTLRRCRQLRAASRVLAVIAGILGLLVLVGGWIFDSAAMRSIIPGAVSMKVNTAIGLMLTAAAILLDASPNRATRQLIRICSGVVVALAAATLWEDLSGRDLSIDNFLIPDRTTPVLVTAPGRMAVATAISFLLLGCSLLLRNRAPFWHQPPIAGAALLCLSNLIGYIYGIDNFAGIAFYTGMAVHTSSGLLMLSIAMLCARPQQGIMALISSEEIGGILARRLLPAAVLVPLLLGWLTWQGELRGMHGAAFGLAVFATANVSVFTYLTWTAGRRLNNVDREKERAAALLKTREDLLTIFVKHVPAAVAMLDREMRYLQVSDRWCGDYGLTQPDVAGRSHYEIFPDLPERWKTILRRGLSGEAVRSEEDQWDRAGGGTTWLCWEIRPWGAEGGLPEGILIFSEDITARKKAETALRESEQQLRELAGSLLTAQEDERRRLARELHDDITQRLAFLSIELGKLAGQEPIPPEEGQRRTAALQAQTLRISAEVRRLSHGLHPSIIEDFGLSIALEGFCEEFSKAQGVVARFEGLIDDSRLPTEAATCLYRVAQESLRNAVDHGKATHVRVDLNAEPGSIQLRIADNGNGFVPNETRTRSGLGLIGMRERIRLVHGTLSVSSQPGVGTEVTANVPLTKAAP